jgi:hypothetical protein
VLTASVPAPRPDEALQGLPINAGSLELALRRAADGRAARSGVVGAAVAAGARHDLAVLLDARCAGRRLALLGDGRRGHGERHPKTEREDPPGEVARSTVPRSMSEGGRHSRRESMAAQATAFALPAALLIYYALRGGSYDIVIRQEEAVALWWLLGLGFGLGLLPRVRLPRGALIPIISLGLLAAWTAVALGWSESDENTVAELARVVHYGGILLLVWSLADRSARRAAAAGLLTAGIAVCALAVVSRLAPDAFPEN